MLGSKDVCFVKSVLHDVPNAASEGQVELRGLHDVYVCAVAYAESAAMASSKRDMVVVTRLIRGSGRRKYSPWYDRVVEYVSGPARCRNDRVRVVKEW